MSHSIRKLAFGVSYPGQTNPLDNHVAISTEEEGSVMYGNFDIILTHHLTIAPASTSAIAPHAPGGVLYIVLVLIGC